MCEKGKCCQEPEQLHGKREDCSPEQIAKCHDDVKEHPCLPPSKTCRQKGKNG